MSTISKRQMFLTKDLQQKKIFVVREFDAPLEDVWRAWTESELLDQWWAPQPWKAETKRMEFREGGMWLYAMVGPEGERNWCRVDFLKIEPQHSFTAFDTFCDENGVKTGELPSMHWYCRFTGSANTTKVEIDISFESEADLTKIVEMGFEEGFRAGMENLDGLIAG